MIEFCSKKRMLAGIIFLGGQWAFEASNYNHFGNYSGLGRNLSICNTDEDYSIIESCHPCSDFEVASKSNKACHHTHFKESVKCNKTGKVEERRGDLYLDVYEVEEDFIQVPIDSAICLLTYHYIGKPNSVQIYFILNKEKTINIELQTNFNYKIVDKIPAPSSFCSLPVFNIPDLKYCVAGFCAVLRQLIKTAPEWISLLGFRQACLVACAEVSIWTKYCEVDLIKSAELTIKNGNEIPVELARLEEHLAQPIRVHNKRKFKSNEHKLGLIVNDHDFKKQLSFIKFEILQSQILIVPIVSKISLYKKDPTRYKPRSKIFTQQVDIEKSLEIISQVSMIDYVDPPGYEMSLNENIPVPDVPESRLKRKMQQLVNLTKSTLKISKPGNTIVDFCCGSGHLGLILAHCLPYCTIILLDNKEKSLDRAKEKSKFLRLDNVYIIQANLDYFIGHFEIGVSLHACGVATDLVLQKCIKNEANFVICPCCYGGIQKNHIVKYPQSKTYQITGLDERSYIILGHCADQAGTEQGEKGMVAVDTDRCLLAKELGYVVHLSKLIPPSCTTRNNLIVASKI